MIKREKAEWYINFINFNCKMRFKTYNFKTDKQKGAITEDRLRVNSGSKIGSRLTTFYVKDDVKANKEQARKYSFIRLPFYWMCLIMSISRDLFYENLTVLFESYTYPRSNRSF